MYLEEESKLFCWCDLDKLTLWKVEILRGGSEKRKTLEQKKTLVNIELSSGYSVYSSPLVSVGLQDY